MKQQLVNLTPHSINYHAPCGQVVTFPSAGVARVDSTPTCAGHFDLDGSQICLVKQTFGDVSGLPDAIDGTLYIVSGLVKSASDRTDLVSPCDFIRNDAGQIIGCQSFTI